MGNKSLEVTLLPGGVQDRSQRFHDIVEEKGGEGVTLTDTSAIAEEVPHLTIQVDGSLAPRDQTNSSVDPPRVKADSEKDLTQETPIYPIKGLFKVQFKENSRKFP